MNRFRVLAASVLTALAVVGTLGAGCLRKSSLKAASVPSLVELPSRRWVSEGYAGPSACAACHPDQHASHGQSRHARSLHVLERGLSPDLLPRLGPMDRSDARIVKFGGRWGLEVPGEGDPLPLDLAFGSGKAGVTFAAVPGSELLEVHRTWFGREGKWFTTPGHERMPAQNVGMMYQPEQTRTCLLCHSTALDESTVVPPTAMRGVGCEACHGPGFAHVEAMRRDPAGPIGIRKLKGAEPSLVNGVCGQCHRARESASPDNSEIGQTNRFQMVGMLKSKCYTATASRLTCVTCHAPHGDAPVDAAPYESACKTCHSPSKSPCPVDNETGCVRCHMPDHPTFKSGGLPTWMADHWIQRKPVPAPSVD